MKKAIVTGATGFLGQWIIKELTSKGVSVIAVIRSSESDIELIQKLNNVNFVICPLNNIRNLPLLIPDNDIDVFYHLAWAGTSGNDRANIQLQLSNVQFTCDAVEAASELGCKKFVYAGSIMEYEAMQNVLSDSSVPMMGNIYSSAKLTADIMAKSLAYQLKIQYITAIISNIYGIGEKSARLVNSTIRKFLAHEKAQFTKGDQLYDFIYASDAARAFYLIGESGVSFTDYYIGNQTQHPLKSFILRIRDVVDNDLPLTFGELPFYGASLDYGIFDTNKLKNEFGFDPEVSFEQGINMTAQWIRDNELLLGGK